MLADHSRFRWLADSSKISRQAGTVISTRLSMTWLLKSLVKAPATILKSAYTCIQNSFMLSQKPRNSFNKDKAKKDWPAKQLIKKLHSQAQHRHQCEPQQCHLCCSLANLAALINIQSHRGFCNWRPCRPQQQSVCLALLLDAILSCFKHRAPSCQTWLLQKQFQPADPTRLRTCPARLLFSRSYNMKQVQGARSHLPGPGLGLQAPWLAQQKRRVLSGSQPELCR